jgi:hypothetical protein
MTSTGYVERLREIRDQINAEIQRKGWEAWERDAHAAAAKIPELARLLKVARDPASLSDGGKSSGAAVGP